LASEQARSFHRAAEEYERGRPGWPPEVLDLLPVADDATVLDLGAGTGKLTRVLAARYAKVFALEPLDELRAILAERVPEAEALPGVAEAIPLGDEEVDAAFAAQSFHWFANDVALAEIARVLRPGGRFASLDFNRPESPAIRAAYLGYLELVGGTLGWALHGEPEAYRYIPASIRRYPGAHGVAARLTAAGLREVSVFRLLGGLMSLHVGTRSA